MNKLALIVIVTALAACDENASRARVDSGGTIVILTGADPGTLFPPLIGRIQGKQIAEEIYDYLADVGPDLNTRNERGFRRQLAESWRWSPDSLQISFQINPRARWHDGRRVTARDVAFTFALNRNPELASYYASSLTNIDSVTVVDSLTPKFWFHRPLPTRFLDAAAQLLILPAHQLENIRASALRETPPPPVGSGRFRFRNWNKGSSIEIVADTGNYRGRAIVDRVIWSVVPDVVAALARLWAGEGDVYDGLRPQDLSDLARHRSLRAIILPGMEYAFLRFNLRDPTDTAKPHPLFNERELRRAITLAIDRQALLRNLLDTFALVPVGPVVRPYPTTDPTISQLPYDSARAYRLLDSLGWVRRGADGIRAKNGRDLAFTILIPTNSLNRQRAGVVIQSQLRRAGVKVNLELLEVNTEIAREEVGAFDAALDPASMAASPDGTWDYWSSKGFVPNGANFGRYASPAFDAAFDSALKADSVRSRDAFSRAYAIINEDAPAVWLYEARKIIGVHRRIHTNVMRPDAWWFSLADWFIPASERIARDRIPPLFRGR
ncbi:MAG TPA: peptide ABC transporter substrate-binding protein [Gemmatimonadaceae bacterium]